jgi:hypothetical protein
MGGGPPDRLVGPRSGYDQIEVVTGINETHLCNNTMPCALDSHFSLFVPERNSMSHVRHVGVKWNADFHSVVMFTNAG